MAARSDVAVGEVRKNYWEVFTNRRIGIMLLLGFASGLPLALTSGTLQAWMTVSGINLHTIGFFTLVGLPYTLKFLWAPLMDRFVPPWLGRRRGWMLSMQLGLIAGIAAVSFISPQQAPWALAGLALLVAFLSASQDIAFDAYRADVLREKERGLGAAVSVLGYRVAMLVSGGLALIVADHLGWHQTYLLMAGLMVIGVFATLLGPEPEVHATPPRTLREAVLGPLREFFARRAALLLLLMIVLYKLGDAFAGSLSTAFLLRGVGFSLTDVGAVNKALGTAAVIVGALLGGGLMVRLGLYRALMAFGVLQAISNLSFMVLAWVGKSYALLVTAVAFENLAGGMGTAAFVAFLMALCNHRYTATQFALLSALAVLGRQYLGPVAGYVVEAIGWTEFFFVTTLTALPGLVLLRIMRREVKALEHGNVA
jgi:PAT family beta-lactamase induction signal transducer AmpG